MLNYSQFQPLQGGKRTFKFKKLIPINEELGLYAESNTKKKLYVTAFANQQQFSIFHGLYKKEIFGNIICFLRKKSSYYCFSAFDGFETLSELIEKHRGEKELISELFCLQLIEQITEAAKCIENAGFTLKILTPFSIILNQNRNNQFKFQLKFPLPHHLFEGLKVAVAHQEIEFCAPEILIMMDNEYDLNRSKFSKSVLYSLGLIMLYCFGYRIKSEQRILALKKSKQFKIFLKAIRKEIKLFQEGKFISKVIKILMEENEYVRDNIETFLIKLHSPHLESLRKFIFKPPQQAQKQAYIPTVYSDYSDQTRKSGLNRTIQIRLSSMSNSHNHQKSDQQGEENNNISDYNLSLFATFKKSPEQYKYPEEIQEVEEDQKYEDSKGEVPSPIEIQLDWDDEDDQDYPIRRTPKKQQKENYKATMDFPEDDLRIAISSVDNDKFKSRDRYHNSDEKPSKNFTDHLKKSAKSISKSIKAESQLQQLQKIDLQLESKGELKNLDSANNSRLLPTQNEKYHVMVEEEPDIIKYSEKEYKIGPSPRLSRKKISKTSIDLQDMTLIEQDQDDEQEAFEVEMKNGTNYQEIKMQFNKKSQAIFMTLLVNFLIYKIIDYFVQ